MSGIEKKIGVNAVPYDQTFIDQLMWQNGFPKRVIDLLQAWLDTGTPPTTLEIERALDESGVPKFETGILDKWAMQRFRAELWLSLEEMDKFIGLPQWTYQKWELFWPHEATVIASPLLSEAIVWAIREWDTVTLTQAIDWVVDYLKNK